MQWLRGHLTFNLASIWAALTGTAVGVVYMFNTFATASDVERIEVRLVKADIREVRAELREYPDDERLQEELEELIDDLCTMKPDDRECK